MQIEGKKLERVLQFVVLLVPWREHGAPCRPCRPSAKVGQGAGGTRGVCVQEPLLWFPQEGAGNAG